MGTDDRHDADGRDRAPITRRKLLATSAIGAASLAGCQDGGSGGDGADGGDGTTTAEETTTAGEETTTTTAEEMEVQDAELVAETWNVPANTQYNSYNAKLYAGRQGGILFEKLAFYSPDENDFIPLLASEWTVDGETMTITVDDAYTWHNGDPLTGPDVATKLKLDRYTGTRISDFVSGVRASNDSTVELDLKGQFNEKVLGIAVLNTRVETKRDLGKYEDLVTRLDDAGSEDERNAVLSELVEWDRSDPTGTGPFSFVEKNQQEAILERYPDHPVADETNYKRYRFVPVSSNQDVWQNLIGGQQDATPYMNLPKRILDQMPDIKELPRPIGATRALFYNHEHPVFSDRRARKAIAYAIDLGPAGKNGYGQVNVPLDGPPVGFHPSVMDQWIDDSSQYISYEQDQERATTLLQNAGLSKENGKWVTGDGSGIEVEIPVPAGQDDTVAIFQTIAGQLKQFGFNAKVATMEGTAYTNTIVTQGDFETLAGAPWAFTQNPHPYFWFNAMFNIHPLGYPTKVEIPPVGKPDGSPKMFDVSELMTQLISAKSTEAAVEPVRKLAWVVNYDLPILPAAARNAQAAIRKTKFEVPALDEPVMNIPSPVHVLPHLGRLTYKPSQ
jgi:peptide/nickel transport system substrate-binding protein